MDACPHLATLSPRSALCRQLGWYVVAGKIGALEQGLVELSGEGVGIKGEQVQVEGTSLPCGAALQGPLDSEALPVSGLVAGHGKKEEP